MKTAAFGFIPLLFLVACSSPGMNSDKEVIAQGGDRPDWVNDTTNQDQPKLTKLFRDDTEKPKYYYVISQATADNEELISSCYDFARSNAGSELARSVDEQIKASSASATDGSSTSHYSEIITHTNTALVGAEILGRHWEKTRDADSNEKVQCWVAVGIPVKHFAKLKANAERTIAEKQRGSKVRRAKKAVQKQQDEQPAEEEDSQE